MNPVYKWADNESTVWITVDIPYVKKGDVRVVLETDGRVEVGAEVNGKKYALKLELAERIRVEVCCEWILQFI